MGLSGLRGGACSQKFASSNPRAGSDVTVQPTVGLLRCQSSGPKMSFQVNSTAKLHF